MKISVIMPVYNGERFIRQSMESVLSQEGDFELEYIICDGLSKDNTVAIAEEYARRDERVKVISRKDKGPGDAINYGFNLATGDIGCWLNADDCFLPGALAKVAAYFSNPGSREWLYGRCIIVDENGRETRKAITLYKEIIGYFYSRNILLCENYINQPATFWRMDLWRRLGGLSTCYKGAWDYELWLKMGEAGGAAKALHSDLAAFRRHSESISENFFEQQFAEELAIASEHGNWLHRLIHRFNCWKIVTVYKLLS